MKRIRLLLALLFASISTITFSQSWVEDVYLFDDFGSTGGTSSGTWMDGTGGYGGAGTGTGLGGSNTFTSTVDGTNKNTPISMKIYAGPTFVYKTKTFNAAGYTSPSNKITISYICKIGATQSSSCGSYYYFRDHTGLPIFGLGIARISGSWQATRLSTYKLYPQTGAAADYANISSTQLLPTAVNSPAIKVTAIIDFSTGAKTVNLTAIAGTYTANASPQFVASSPANQYTNTALPFIDANAADLADLLIEANNPTASGGVSAVEHYRFDDFKIAGEKLSSTYGDVVIKYQDTEGNSLSSIKPDISSHTHLPDASTFSASGDELSNFSDLSYNYIYDFNNTTNSVTVVGNSTVNLTLKFKKYPIITNSTLTWTGAANGTWSDLYANFTSDGVNSLGHQNTNSFIFPETASNKTINLNSSIDLGAHDLTISGNGYNISTGVSGSITGTGSLNINLTTGNTLTLNTTNSISGTTHIDGGTITVGKTGSIGSSVIVNNATTLIPTTGVTFPTTTFNANSSINCGGIQSSISNITIAADCKLTINSSFNGLATDVGYVSFGFGAGGTLNSRAELDFYGTATNSRFGMNSASTNYLLNARVTLRGNSFLFINAAQSDATTINIGTLAGETNTSLGWGKTTALDRTITWSVGSLNESSTYAGTITNTGAYSSGGNSYTGNFTHFVKVGTAKLTFSGTANTHNGNFTVSGGELEVTGNIGKSSTTMAVSNTSTLSVKNGGTVTAGTLTVASGALVSVDATSNIALTNVTVSTNGTGAGRLNLRDATVIPALTVSASDAPAVGTSFTVVSATDPSTIVYTADPIVPDGYSFNKTTGVLTYNGKSITATSAISSVSLGYTNGTINVSNGATLTVDANATYNKINVAAGSNLTVDATKTLTANVILESNENGTATLIDNGTITGTITVKQYLTGSNSAGTPNGRFWYVSSPISNATSGVFAPSTGNKFWSHSEVDGYAPISTDNVDLTPGKGYVTRMKENTTVLYTGTPNTGDKSIEITRTGTTNLYRGFNLIGNPYPSFARIKSSDNTSIESSLWFRTKVAETNSMVFDTYNFATGDSVSGSGNPISGFIPPMQAFWVKTMTAGTSNVVFKQAYRFHGDPITSGIKLRGANVDSTACIRIRLSNGKTKDETLVKLYPNASDAFDRFDSRKMTNSVDSFPEIFTMNGSDELAINGLRHDGRTKALALGFRTGRKGNFKLKVIERKNLGDSLKVILKDKIKNCEKELLDSTEYDFTSDVVTTADRFSIVITANAPTALKNTVTASAEAFGTSDKQIQIRLIGTTDNNALVTVYSAVGQQIGSFATSSANTVIDKRFAPGIYLVNIAADGMQITKKVVINQ